MIDPDKLQNIKSIPEFIEEYKTCGFCGKERQVSITDYDSMFYTLDREHDIFLSNDADNELTVADFLKKKKLTLSIFSRCYDNDDNHEMEASLTRLHNDKLSPFQDTISFDDPDFLFGVLAKEREVNEPLQLVLETYQKGGQISPSQEQVFSKEMFLNLVSNKDELKNKIEKLLLLKE